MFALILCAEGWAQEGTKPTLQTQIDARQPMTSADVVTVAVRLPKAGVQAGTTFEAFVMVQVAAGWHINAHEPSQPYYIGTALEVEPHPLFPLKVAYYPDPLYRTFAFTSDTLAVYEGEIAVILAMQAAERLQPATYSVQSQLKVQACNDAVCLRPATVTVPIPIDVRKAQP